MSIYAKKIEKLRKKFPFVEKKFSNEQYNNELFNLTDEEFKSYFNQLYIEHHYFSRAFSSFYLSIIDSHVMAINKKLVDKTPLTFFHFKSYKYIHSSWLLAERGYAVQGYALLRSLLESAIFMSAQIQGITTLSKIHGGEENKKLSPTDPKRLHSTKEEQSRIIKLMIGRDSGLNSTVIKELALWKSLFDKELHQNLISDAENIDSMRESSVTFLAQKKDTGQSMFLNRYVEISLILIRLLFCLQTKQTPFSQETLEKLKVLDEWARIIIKELTEKLDKPIGNAFCSFVDAKFPFNETSGCGYTHLT